MTSVTAGEKNSDAERAKQPTGVRIDTNSSAISKETKQKSIPVSTQDDSQAALFNSRSELGGTRAVFLSTRNRKASMASGRPESDTSQIVFRGRLRHYFMLYDRARLSEVDKLSVSVLNPEPRFKWECLQMSVCEKLAASGDQEVANIVGKKSYFPCDEM